MIVSNVTTDDQAYQDYLASRAHVNITQAYQWPQVKAGWGVIRLMAFDGETPCGAAQILTITDSATGKNFAYLPRGPVCDPTRWDVIESLMTKAIEVSRERGISILRCDPEWLISVEESDRELDECYAHSAQYFAKLGELAPSTIRKYPEHLKGQPPFVLVGEIPDANYDLWFEGLQRRKRRAIRKAYRDGVETYITRERETVEVLYELIEQTCQRQGITHRPKDYFYRLRDTFEGCFFAVGEYEGKIVSAILAVAYGDTVYALYAGNDLSASRLNSPSATYARVFKEASERGIKYVDTGGIFHLDRTKCNLYDFKRKLTGTRGIRAFVGEVDYLLDGEE